MASVNSRLISSGIVRSKLRRPASTWATFTPSFTAASAQPTVLLTSPNTTKPSGLFLSKCSSYRSRMRAVCAPCDPDPTSR